MKSIYVLFLTVLLTACGGSGSGPAATGSGNGVVSIAVTPASVTVSKGLSAQMHATGVYSDGSTADLTSKVTWVSLHSTAAAIDSSGVVSGVAVGDSVVTASLGGVTSPYAWATVNSAALTGISITPAVTTLAAGTHATLRATGTYSDGTSSNISTQVVWTPSAPATASVDGSGVAAGNSVGSTTVVASLNGITSQTVSVVVTPATLLSISIPVSATIPKGSSSNLTATGIYTDGTTADITNTVTWTSVDPKTAPVGISSGVVVGASIGSTTITASVGSITSNPSIITVTQAALQSISIGQFSTVIVGSTIYLQAVGTYTDGSIANVTAQSIWRSTLPGYADVYAGGGVFGTAVGTTSITASVGSVTSPEMTINVVAPALVQIQVNPTTVAVVQGASINLQATGYFSDSSVADVTAQASWISASPAIAAVGPNTGIVVGTSVGSTTISCEVGAVASPPVTIFVFSSALISIDVSPASINIPVYGAQQLSAIGHFADSSTGDITGAVSWSMSASQTMTPNAIVDQTGMFHGVSAGVGTMNAVVGNVTSNTVNFTVY